MILKIMTISILIMFVLTLGCASVRVAVEYDESVDFSAYQSFAFVQPKRANANTGRKRLMTKEMMQQTKPILEAKGLSEAGRRQEADVLIVFYTKVRNQADYVPATYHVGRWGRVRRVSPGHVVRYKEGTLVIDIVDRQKKELVWQGVGQGVLNRSNPMENFIEAVNEILERYPPEN